MLIKCPRCGFSQPQDRYCAQCGIDMISYVPPKKPEPSLHRKYPFLFISIILVLVLVGLYLAPKGSLYAGIRSLGGSIQLGSGGSGNKLSYNDEASRTARTDEVEGVNASPPIAKTEANNAPATAQANEQELAYKMSVVFAEVDIPYWQKISMESQATGQFRFFGDYSAGIILDLKKKLESYNSSVQKLHTMSLGIDREKPAQFSQMVKADLDSDEGLGLTGQVELSDEDANVLRIQVEIQRFWRESLNPNDQVTPSSFPASFELPPNAGFFIAGLLPNRTPLAQLEKLTANEVFKILKSQKFKSQQSTFVIFFLPEKK